MRVFFMLLVLGCAGCAVDEDTSPLLECPEVGACSPCDCPEGELLGVVDCATTGEPFCYCGDLTC